MQDQRDTIAGIIKDAIVELNEELDYDQLRAPNDATVLFEGDDSLDSLSLVSLIVDIEARVGDNFEVEVVLASEKAMSMKNSPYRNVGALTQFVLDELSGEQSATGS